MTQDEIIDMAKQAGIEEAYSLKHNQYLVRFKDGSLEVFAKLVAERALAEHAMRETQRLGQEIEPVADDIASILACRDMLDAQPVPPRRTEQEPVAWMCADESLINKGYERFSRYASGEWKIPVYTTPPQRTWVGLTDEEQQQAYEQWQNDGWGVFYNAIEAKLKEKNT
jgi:hypothetical protein